MSEWLRTDFSLSLEEVFTRAAMSQALLDPLTLDQVINEEEEEEDTNSLWEHEALAQVCVCVIINYYFIKSTLIDSKVSKLHITDTM